MSQSPLSGQTGVADNCCTMRCPCSVWKVFLLLSALFALALFLTACSGVSSPAGNTGGTGGGSGGGTGGSNLACNVMSVGQTAKSERFCSILQQQPVECRHLIRARRPEFQYHHQQLGGLGKRSSRLGNRSHVRHPLRRGQWKSVAGQRESAVPTAARAIPVPCPFPRPLP